MSTCDFGASAPCESCGDPLSAVALDHGTEGFGHEGVCCACYEQRMRGDKPRNKRHRRRT